MFAALLVTINAQPKPAFDSRIYSNVIGNKAGGYCECRDGFYGEFCQFEIGAITTGSTSAVLWIVIVLSSVVVFLIWKLFKGVGSYKLEV